MTLHVHRAERSDVLVDALGDVLADPLNDPFAVDVVAVPARGVERWLRQRLAHRLGVGPGPADGHRDHADQDGVCLNLEMPSPAMLFAEVVGTALAFDPTEDPWRTEALQWRILQVVDDCATQPWAAMLAAHLGYTDRAGDEQAGELRRGRRVAVAARLAGLYTSYAAQRPQMLHQWLGDLDSGGASGGNHQAGAPQVLNTDGFGALLGEEHRWHPDLFRELVARLGTPNPAQKLADGLAAIRSTPSALELPQRLSLFGPTRLSSADLAVLVALAEHRDVHLWLPHPSPTSWDRLADALAAGEFAGPVPARRDAGIARLIRNPLLRSLGRDSQELQLRLAAAAPDARHLHHGAGGHHGARVDHAESVESSRSVLGVLQDALRDDSPQAVERVPLTPGDDTVQVHACHGRARQVEVLRDVITGLLADDPSLQPRDILVMCPDIEAFAPLLLGAFGASDLPNAHPGQQVRLRLADRSLRQTNPMLGVIARLLELAASRVSATEVLDLAALAPIRHRFGFTDDHLGDLHRLVAHTNIRWGLTVADREPYGLAGIADNTWHLGLDSWLLGIAMDPDSHQAGLPGWPAAGIESAQVELVGRFTEFIHRLAGCLRALHGVRPLSEWVDVLRTGLDQLTLAEPAAQWQRIQADRVLATALHAGADPDVELRRTDLVNLLADELRGRPTRSSFRSGDLTACSMVPMRSVPHRVVCLLGVDDGDLPRQQGLDGDDILAVEPRIGERDVAAEDRQLLLDALLAATERLVICYSGADERTGARRPPAVPLGELLDELDARLTSADRPAREHLVRVHPLQPFDLRNFRPGDPDRSFDQTALDGAKATARRRDPASARTRPEVTGAGQGHVDPARIVLRQALPGAAETLIDLDRLIEFYNHPVRFFLRHRLGLSLRDFADDLDSELPISLDGLQRWNIGDRMLRARLNGVPADLTRTAELRRGVLPPRALGDNELHKVEREVEQILRAVGADLSEPVRAVDVQVDLPDGRGLRGSLAQVRGSRLVTIQFGSVHAHHRLASWIRLLAAVAGSELEGCEAVTRGKKGGGVRQSAPERRVAVQLLADLVAGYDAGLREPLPLPPKTADAYAAARRRQDPAADQRAAGQWAGNYPENDDVEYVRTIGTSWPQLVRVSQLSELRWPLTAHGETHWFGQIARAVFDPLAAHERALG